MVKSYDIPSFVSSNLYELSKSLAEKNPDGQYHGFMGGEYGYGQNFKNDVFEMMPYYWGECDCGYDEKEEEFINHFSNKSINDTEKEMAWHQFAKENHHSDRCSIIRPNFEHFSSKTEISWYKYIGRGMSCNKKWDHQKWMEIFLECSKSLNIMI